MVVRRHLGPHRNAGDIFNYCYRDLHRCTIKIKVSLPGTGAPNVGEPMNESERALAV